MSVNEVLGETHPVCDWKYFLPVFSLTVSFLVFQGHKVFGSTLAQLSGREKKGKAEKTVKNMSWTSL